MKKKLFVFSALFISLAFFSAGLLPVQAITCSLYVATNGNDSSGNGSSSAPYATINKAQSVVRAGDTVCVRSGTYSASKIRITSVGTSASPILFTKDPGTNGSVILDGTGASIGAGQAVVTISNAQYVTFDGFEVTRSAADGIDVDNASNITISNNKIHETQSSASVMTGSHITFTQNEVYNASLKNVNDAYGSGGWPGTVLTWVKPDGTLSTDVNFTKNYIHDTWGEGIIALYLDGALIQGNTVKDAFGVLIYSDRAKNVKIDSNYVAMTTDAHNKSGKRPDGILLAAEGGSDNNVFTPGTSNVMISNNVVLGTNYGIGYWQDTRNTAQINTYSNVHIYYNVVKDTKSAAIWIDAVNSPYQAPSQSDLKNNIIYAGANGSALTLNNASAWTFGHNDWPNGIPSADSAANGSLAVDPLFISPTSGSYQTNPDGYKLQATSPVIGKGTAVSVVKDYYNTARPAANTDIGSFQGTAVVASPSVTPSPVASPTPSPSPQASPTVCIGDINLDHKVDVLDYSIMSDNFFESPLLDPRADLDNDGKVNVIDYAILVDHLLDTCP